MIIGTAGHVDHGKSVLVEALTGRRMDRLAEERARGITIELNFAPLVLLDGVTAGVVDVPGHEDFVRMMVAGAAGMDIVLLVVAADEGIMPQTREHLAVIEALAVPCGIPVLSKCDLVDPDWLALVQEEIDRWLARSSVAFQQTIPVSARTGEGIEALRTRLNDVASSARSRDPSASFRMPVDRAFSIAGAGTVVTGSVWSGSLGIGDQIRLLPSNRPARVRTIEVHGARTERAVAGQRAALGLAHVDRDQVQRGDVVVDAHLPWESTSMLDVRLHLLPTAPRPLTSRSRVHLHLGTAEVIARVLPPTPIPPGGSGMARLVCEAPVVAAGGDRFVIRSYSPVSTIGGGLVLDPFPPSRRTLRSEALGSPILGDHLRALITRGPPGASTDTLALRAGVTSALVLATLQQDPSVRELPGVWVLEADVRDAREKALKVVAVYHAEHPATHGMPIATLRRMCHRSMLVADAAVDDLAAAGAIVVLAGAARLPGFEAGIPGGAAAVQRIVELVRGAGLAAPPVAELARQVGRVDVAGALRLAAGAGKLQAVTRDWYVAEEALEGFRALLMETAGGGEITLAQVRERTGLSRKHLIPLLEWADRQGITHRDGEARKLT